MTEPKIDADRLLTSHEVGSLLQVNPSSINKWVNEGRLAAFRTPGGHRRIRAADLVRFLDAHKMPIPRVLSGASRKKLLVCDDEQPQLTALTRALKPYGDRIQALMVTNGIDALIQVGLFKPNAILLDVFMPEIDGLEVCRRLKSNEETRNIDVIVSTGQMTKDIEEKALAAGARRVLTKPLDVKALVEELGLSQQYA